MKLKALLHGVKSERIEGSTERSVSKVRFDSRKVTKGDLFVATQGVQVDGHDYIEKAIQNGAVVIVAEHFSDEECSGVTKVLVGNSAIALGQIVANYFGNPSTQLKLIGITGTNGKTTTATLLHDLLSQLGYKVGLLSTIENKIGGVAVPSTHTTPDAIAINSLLAEMVDAGCEFAFMEVSSHAIHQHRVSGLKFAGGVFTNITHDHLDYHKDFKSYIEAKKMFFDALPKEAFALTNIDDKNGSVMLQNTLAQKAMYSLRRPADFRARVIDNSLTGLQLEINGIKVFCRLIGEFNAYNLLVVYATAILLKQDETEVLQALSILKGAEGRFDYIVDPRRGRIGVIDYAHTPDALENVLNTIQGLKKGNQQIFTVVGCGGDRDRAKRPIMAKIAADNSDQVILTSDNPRTEDPVSIIKEMEVGLPPNAKHKTLSILDRVQAIRTACRLAKDGDLILVAGKGHEKYQEVNGEKIPMDEKEILNTEFEITD